jgi:hypothetical protein
MAMSAEALVAAEQRSKKFRTAHPNTLSAEVGLQSIELAEFILYKKNSKI